MRKALIRLILFGTLVFLNSFGCFSQNGPLTSYPTFPQPIHFNYVDLKENRWGVITRYPGGVITGIAEDRQGYIWLISQNEGLYKYDGDEVVTYTNDSRNPNSIAGNGASSIFIDSSGIIWLGLLNGLDRFDPVTKTFTHFRHNPNESTSLSSDSVSAILEDHAGNLWIGTHNGLNLLDRKTGKFTRYINNPADAETISSNHVWALYEDHQGSLWIGCGTPSFLVKEKPEEGGFNRLKGTTGKFTRYLHDPADPTSIANNKVTAIFEDSKGNFWVGTAGDGLHTMNRATGKFTHYYYDASHPDKLSRPPLNQGLNFAPDYIRFIKEDITGAIWIGTVACGINRYDPATNKITHYGYLTKDGFSVVRSDTAEGFKNFIASVAISSKDGLFWIGAEAGKLCNVNFFRTTLPYYAINDEANSFYLESGGNIFWIATLNGLIRKDLNTNQQKQWRHNPLNHNSLCNDSINVLRIDKEGKFWIATFSGLSKFDPLTNTFTSYLHNEKDPGSLSCNVINNLYIDNNNLWIATVCGGLDVMNTETGLFTHYKHDDKNNSSLIDDNVVCVTKDKNNVVWVGTMNGVDRMDNINGKFKHYLSTATITSLHVDSDGIVWAGARDGLYYFDITKDNFFSYSDINPGSNIPEVLSILEDDKKNLWVTTVWSIIKINTRRDDVKIYGENCGVHQNTFLFSDNFKARNGQLFLGDQNGYYAFFPNELENDRQPPSIIFTSFKLGDDEIKPGPDGVLSRPVWATKEISLNYKQNVFSFDFKALHYNSPGEEKYLFMLENYDDAWNDIGTDHKAFFFNVPSGHYIFRVRAVNPDGTTGEKSISIIIATPWWQTIWFRVLALILVTVLIFILIRWRTRVVRKEEQEKAKQQQERSRVEKEILELEAKALRAQMNPHFIFNCMNSIKSLIQKNEHEKAIEYLTTFSKLIRTIFQSSDKQEITLHDEIETCRLYTQLESMRFGNKLNYSFDIDEQADFKSVMVPHLILQPFIENAIWHGLMPKTEGGMLYVGVTEKESKIYCVVEDDGIGRGVSMQNKFNDVTAQHQSKGMRLTQSRLELNNKLNQRNATVEIIDKTNDIGEAVGTKVILVFNEE